MPEYAAFLGHQPRISIAEIAATIPDFTLERSIGKNVALFSTARALAQDDLRRWGGTYLLARRITESLVTLDDVPQLLSNELKTVRGKAMFALRTVGVPRPQARSLYRTSKDFLKRLGRSSRYVGNERTPAAAALLRDAGMLDGSSGAELVLLQEGEEDEVTLWIGRTVAAQDPDAYVKRDMGKPVRDTRSGLLPPKLAQVLLNFGLWLAESRESRASSREKKTTIPPGSRLPFRARGPLRASSGKTPVQGPRAPQGLERQDSRLIVYDPFCGTGVIPMECLLKGLSVLASDASLRAVHGCEKNLDWLRRQENIKKTDVLNVVFKRDALKPFDFSDVQEAGLRHPSVIVTETCLGPALTKRPNVKEAAKLRTENEALQIAFLTNVAASLPGVPVVLTWPVWYLKTGPLFLEKVWKVLPELGFNPMLPPHTQPEVPGHFSLLYRRPDQIVGREIVLLKPRKR